MRPSVETYNEQQKELRQLLLSADREQEAIELFLRNHALLHSAELLQGESLPGET